MFEGEMNHFGCVYIGVAKFRAPLSQMVPSSLFVALSSSIFAVFAFR